MNKEMSNPELLSKLLMMWHLSETNNSDDRFITDNEEDPISKIIYHRTKQFNVKLPVELAYIISICSNGNPGRSIIIYYYLLENIVKRNNKLLPRNGYVITAMDFALTFSESFPDSSIPEQDAKFSKLWDEQKCKEGNKVDLYGYWNELFEY